MKNRRFFLCISPILWCLLLVMMFPAGFILKPVPVSAAELAWSVVNTPGPTGSQLVPGSDCSLFEVATDGNTMFVYDNAGKQLYKSTNAGVTWTSASIGNNLNGNILTDMAISPNYVTDSTLVACGGSGAAAKVWRSINSGATWGEVGANVGGLIAANSTLTSIDIAEYYIGGQAIMVGDGDVTGLTGVGGVSLYTNTGLAWTDLEVTLPPGGTCDVVAVAFSPNHKTDVQLLTDGQILALCVDATGTWLVTKFATESWNLTIVPARIMLHRPTYGVIEFPKDYEWSSHNKILIGTANASDANDDVYVISGGLPGGPTTVVDMDANGTSTECNVTSISINGNFIGSKVLVGQWASLYVKRTADISAGTVAWSSSTKSPTGGATAADYVTVRPSPLPDIFYAATTGIGSAFSRSVDGGITWNQIALIDISAMANLSIPDFSPVDVNTGYLLMYDDAVAPAGYSDGDYSMLFKTVNGGVRWEMIWSQRATGDAMMQYVRAMDASTVFVAQTDTCIWKATDGGSNWVDMATPASITAFYAVDATTYYTGAATGFYKSDRLTSPSLPSAVNSIAVAPDGTIYIGDVNGSVYSSTDDGNNFGPPIGGASALGAGNRVFVAVDPAYTTNKTVYAGSDGAGTFVSQTDIGVFRWVVDTSADWTQIDSGPDWNGTDDAANNTDDEVLLCAGMGVTSTGTLYAASKKVNQGVRRSFHPTSSTPPPTFESLTTDLPAGAQFRNLQVINSNVLYGVVGNVAPEDYGYTTRVVTYDEPQPTGDANGDGMLDAADITNIERIICGLDAPTPGADANQDGSVNALDITKTERIIAQLD